MSKEEFQDAAALKAWLITQGVDDEDAETAALSLYSKGFCYPSTLIDITSTQLESQGINTPMPSP